MAVDNGLFMNDEELRKRIQYLREVEGLSFHQMAEEFGVGRKRCSKLYYDGVDSSRALAKVKILDPYKDLISQWFSEHPSLSATQVFERLRARGVEVSYPSVTLYTKESRQKKQKCYWPLTFLPGEEAQVDWFFYTHPVLGKLSGFAFILSYSRHLFAHFFPRHSFEFFIQGHLMAFRCCGGITRALRYDNLRSVVLKRTPLTYNPAFLDFARYYKFEIRLCNVARGNEKGRVERAIRTLRGDFLNICGHHQSLSALNQALHEWTANKNAKIHRATKRTPHELLKEEQLRSLPQHEWQNALVHPLCLPSKLGLITFDTNRYSVPEHLVGQRLAVHSFCDRIDIYTDQGQKVASHPRSFAHNQTFINPLHRTFTKISSQAKKARIYSVIKNLDPVVEIFLEQNKDTGDNAYTCAYSLFTLLRSHARNTVLSAIREALRHRLPRIKTVVSLLTTPSPCSAEEVLPQHQDLLQLDYQPRSLAEYEHGDLTKNNK